LLDAGLDPRSVVADSMLSCGKPIGFPLMSAPWVAWLGVNSGTHVRLVLGDRVFRGHVLSADVPPQRGSSAPAGIAAASVDSALVQSAAHLPVLVGLSRYAPRRAGRGGGPARRRRGQRTPRARLDVDRHGPASRSRGVGQILRRDPDLHAASGLCLLSRFGSLARVPAPVVRGGAAPGHRLPRRRCLGSQPADRAVGQWRGER
jgi:hypothetical protein